MAAIKSTDEARERANTRWRRPDVVDRRVDALAEHVRRVVDSLPPLTPDQRARLAALLRPTDGSGA